MKKKNHIKVRFSTILLCILAILLCSAPCGGATFGINYDGGEYDVTEDLINEARAEEGLGEGGLDWLHIGADTTVNLYADISQYVYAYPGSILNIYSGNVGLYIIVMPGEPSAVVTVYGTDFGGDGDFSIPGEVSFSGGTLTGDYGGDGGSFELNFISSVPILLRDPDVSEVEIDIKPGSDNNSINLKSKGVVPVAVLTTVGFDASTVDPGSVEFAGAEPVRWRLCDVDDDGDMDVLFHFKTQELNLEEDSTEATLTGTANEVEILTGTANEVEISGTDTVRIVPQKKKK